MNKKRYHCCLVSSADCGKSGATEEDNEHWSVVVAVVALATAVVVVVVLDVTPRFLEIIIF
jgi:predicted GTPase